MASDPIVELALPTGWRGVLMRAGLAGLRASLRVSPRPMAWALRRQFAHNGEELAATLRSQAPDGVTAVIDEQYADSAHTRLDVFTPSAQAAPGDRLPTVVWTHGGAFVGGNKDELAGYFRMIAAAGFTVVGVNYSVAPGAHYPTPARELLTALEHLQANSERLHVDPTCLILAGDSAGAHISAQVALIVTDSRYAEKVGLKPTIVAEQLRGVALCCGVYDMTVIDPASPLEDFITAVGWSYSGTRDFRNNDQFTSTVSLTRHMTNAFPPAFVTAGNDDPLLGQSHEFVAALQAAGVAVDTMFFPADHEPRLPHEYQFDVSLDDGRAARDRLIAFFRQRADGHLPA